MTAVALASSPAVRVFLVGVLFLVAQTSLVADFPVFGVTADVMLLYAVLCGLIGGPDWGAAVGFGGGLAVDLVLQTPFGLSALAGCLAGYAVGGLHTAILRSSWWILAGLAAAGSALGVALFALIGSLVAQRHLLGHVWVVMVVVAVVNGLLTPALAPVVRWALAGVDEDEDR